MLKQQKFIHYCWFGDKPLPKSAKKCIKSWKKYLPDHKIIKWSEDNVNLDECPFIKGAYEAKKWAFVSDYVRTRAMCVYGGIYFDTDMKITKNIDKLFRTEGGFLGAEDSHMIACGVWYEKHPHSYLAEQMLKFYQSQPFFDIDNMQAISIPRVISSILDDYDPTLNETQYLKHNETIYRRDYFYPYSYDFRNNLFTKDTCMIHYYDASWVSKKQQRDNKIYRRLGKKNGEIYIKISNGISKVLKGIFVYPFISHKKTQFQIDETYLNDLEDTYNKLSKIKKKSYVAVVNPYLIDAKEETEELFDNVIYCRELYRKKDIKKLAQKMSDLKIKEVVFSGFYTGWKELCKQLYKNNIVVKVYLQDSQPQIMNSYIWDRNKEIIELYKKGYITKIASCNEGLSKLYKKQGIDVTLLHNGVNLKPKEAKGKRKIKKIGIYGAKTDEFIKNAFNQIAAVSLLNDKNIIIDMVPITNQAIIFCNQLGLNLEGSEEMLEHDEFLKRMSKNDINLYVTFSESATVIPLESFSSGVPCLTGNNHQYFKDSNLEKYSVVSNEASPAEIKEKIETCFKSRKTVLDAYKKWHKANEKIKSEEIEKYLKTKGAKK